MQCQWFLCIDLWAVVDLLGRGPRKNCKNANDSDTDNTDHIDATDDHDNDDSPHNHQNDNALGKLH